MDLNSIKSKYKYYDQPYSILMDSYCIVSWSIGHESNLLRYIIFYHNLRHLLKHITKKYYLNFFIININSNQCNTEHEIIETSINWSNSTEIIAIVRKQGFFKIIIPRTCMAPASNYLET